MKLNKEKINKILNILIVSIIVIQPLLDIFKNLFGDLIQIFVFSLFELINILFIILILFLSFVILDKKQKKNIVYIFIVYLIYLIAHYLNMSKFANEVYNYKELNFFKEFYYILRCYIQPLILLWCIYINKIDKKKIYLAIKILVGIISFVMIISNIFNFAFLSYSVDNVRIQNNIFSWFRFNGENFNLLKSKGLFYSANQLSNLMFVLLPIIIYICYNENKKINYLLLFCHLVSMFILGTRTATFGAAILCSISTVLVLLFNIIKKDKLVIKNSVKLVLVFLITLPIFCFSPLILEKINEVNKVNDLTNNSNQKEEEKEWVNKFNIRDGFDLEKYGEEYNLITSNLLCENFNYEQQQSLIDYMNHNYYYHRINKVFIDLYPVENDFEFWCNNYRRDSYKNVDSRIIKTEILSRITENNNNINDYFYGIGYSLGLMEIERDYYQQYYWFGFFGLILLVFPYLIIFGYSCYIMLKNFKVNFTLENIFFLISILAGLVISYFSGHFYGKIFIMLIYSSIVAIGYRNIKES